VNFIRNVARLSRSYSIRTTVIIPTGLCQPFKASYLRVATADLTLKNFSFCPHCIYVFCIYLRINSDLCHLQHKLIGFYNRDEVFTARYGLGL